MTKKPAKKAKANGSLTLDRAERLRLYGLLEEAASLGITLNEILKLETPEDCDKAWPILHQEQDGRIAQVMEILHKGISGTKEEASS